MGEKALGGGGSRRGKGGKGLREGGGEGRGGKKGLRGERGGGKDINRERWQRILGRKREKISGGEIQQGKGGQDLREEKGERSQGGKGVREEREKIWGEKALEGKDLNRKRGEGS